MFGNSENNRREGQGGCREANLKEACIKDTTVGTRTDSEAGLRAMSVLGNAKSKCHRKAHQVESGGTGRKFMHLTRGDLWSVSSREVSRGDSSEDALGNLGRAKDRRIGNATSTIALIELASRQLKPEQHCNIGSLCTGRAPEVWVDSRHIGSLRLSSLPVSRNRKVR